MNGGEALKKSLIARFGEGRKFTFVIGMQKSKEIQPFLQLLKPIIKKAIFVKSKHPLAEEPDKLCEMGEKEEIDSAVESDLSKILNFAEKEDLVVTGSLFLVGEMNSLFG